MKYFTKTLILLLLVSTGLMASGTHNVQILTAPNADGKITTKTIESVFEKAGFFINDNRDMLPPFIKNFKTVDYDVYSLFTIFKTKEVVKLGKKYPKIGLFTPMSMSIYTRKNSKEISVSSLTVEAMAKIMDIPKENPDLLSYVKSVQDTLLLALPNAKKEIVSYSMKKDTGKLVSSFSKKIDEDFDIDDFQELEFEPTLPENDFINAGFNDVNYYFEEAEMENYSFYTVHSICNISVIYIVSQKHPEAGAFAPCSLYMYNKKGSKTMEIGFPSVYNWIASLAIEDKESIDILMSAQTKMEDILKKLTSK